MIVNLLRMFIGILTIFFIVGCDPKTKVPVFYPPVLTADAGEDQTVSYDMPVDLNGSGSKQGSYPIVSYTWSVMVDQDENLTLGEGINFTYTPSDYPLLGNNSHTVTLTVEDENGSTDTDDVNITIVDNLPPVAVAVLSADEVIAEHTLNVFEGVTVTLDGSSSYDPDGEIVSYLWKEGDTVLSTSARFEMSDLSLGLHTIILTVTDDDGATDVDIEDIYVVDGDVPPVADAGEDQTVVGPEVDVLLDGTGSSDADGDIVTYKWDIITKPEGSEAFIYHDDGSAPFLIADLIGLYVIRLTVTDNDGLTDTDTVNIIVTETLSNLPPVADAGADQTVVEGTTVTLDGTGSSDPDGTIISYLWQEGNTELSTSERFDKSDFSLGQHTIKLIVTDNDGATDQDIVHITVTTVSGNIPPVAEAGEDQAVLLGETVTLDGSGSYDLDGTIVSYLWKEGDTELSTSASFVKSDFGLGLHTITLTVTDNNGSTDTDEVNISVTTVPANLPPVADAGEDQAVLLGETVTLDGTGSSDPDGTIVSYLWKEGDTELSTSASFVKSDFGLGLHTITLTVTDDDGATGTDEVNISVTTVPINLPPVADAGEDKYLSNGDQVILDGSGSYDPDGEIIAYLWKEGDTELSTNEIFKTYDFDLGLHTITLTVTDNNGATDTDEVNVSIRELLLPVADAGEDQTVVEGQTVILDGSGSYDPDGEIVVYGWYEGGDSLSFDISFEKSDFSLGVHTIMLQVTDDDGQYSVDFVDITVVPQSTIIPIVQTGQTESYDMAGNVVVDGSVKDDGFFTAGIGVSFTDNSDGTVTDNITNLIWEVDYSAEFTLAQAEAYCTAIGPDWRIPNLYESLSIINYWETSALDTTVFNVPVDGNYWTDTNEAGSASDYWTIDTTNGEVQELAVPDTSTNYVRCVKGEELMPPLSERFTKIDTDGSSLPDSAATWVAVKDNWTGLLWEKNNVEFFDWLGAIDYCENLTLAGNSNWHLPNIRQIHYLMDMTKADYALDSTYFSTENTSLLSSTTNMFNTLSYVWAVSQINGTNEPGGILKYETTYDALCVSWE